MAACRRDLHHVALQNLLRQKDAELKQANAELEERGKLLYKTKVCVCQACNSAQKVLHVAAMSDCVLGVRASV